MVFSYIMFFVFIPFCLMKFILNLNHLLISLLTLEMISLSFFFGLSIFLFFFDSVFLLYFLIMIVCEGVLGLCLLVVLSFNYGYDYIYVLNKLMC